MRVYAWRAGFQAERYTPCVPLGSTHPGRVGGSPLVRFRRCPDVVDAGLFDVMKRSTTASPRAPSIFATARM